MTAHYCAMAMSETGPKFEENLVHLSSPDSLTGLYKKIMWKNSKNDGRRLLRNS